MNFTLQDLARYFDSSARDRNDATANLYGAPNGAELATLYDEVVDEIVRILELSAHSRLLDVGCGSGEILARLAPHCADITGVDIAPSMATLVREKGFSALAYDGKRLPFGDGLFDVVIIYQVFINLPDARTADALVREAVRVARRGGRILIGAVPHPESSPFRTHDAAWRFNLKRVARRLLLKPVAIPYYAYPYAFFGRLLDALDLQSLSLVPCRIRRDGWQTKYHALLVK